MFRKVKYVLLVAGVLFSFDEVTAGNSPSTAAEGFSRAYLNDTKVADPTLETGGA